MSKNAYAILGILQDLAPNAEAQEKCAEVFREAERDFTDKGLLTYMTGLLYDGLRYGNYPWVVINEFKTVSK